MSKPNGSNSDNQRNVQNPRDAMSLLSGDNLIVFRKKFFFPNNLVTKLPGSADRIQTPPAGYIGVYETTLRAGLRFPPVPELVDILKAIGVSISQFSCRAMTIVAGLIVLFREKGSRLTPEILSRFGGFSIDSSGRVSFKSRNFIFITKELVRYWSVGFFFVRNDWGLRETQGRPVQLPCSLQITMDEILPMLGFQESRDLQLEVRNIGNFVREERLFRTGVSIQPGRSSAVPPKRFEKKRPLGAVVPPERQTQDSDCVVVSARCCKGDNAKKTCRKEDERDGSEAAPPLPDGRNEADKSSLERVSEEADIPASSSLKIPIPEHIRSHLCSSYVKHEEWKKKKEEIDSEYFLFMRKWNSEFVRTKYLKDKSLALYESKCKEVEELGAQLSGCRAELSTMATRLSVQGQALEHAEEDLIDTRTRLREDTRLLSQRVAELEEENRKLRSERVVDTAEVGAAAVEMFKGSFEFRTLIRDAEQGIRDQIYDMELQGLQREYIEEGFIRGFLKGIRAVHRRTGAEIDGLTPSQASEDPPSHSDGEEVVSGLHEGETEDEEDVQID